MQKLSLGVGAEPWASEMTYWARCLVHKPGDLSWPPEPHIGSRRKLTTELARVAQPPYNLKTTKQSTVLAGVVSGYAEKAETGGLQV